MSVIVCVWRKAVRTHIDHPNTPAYRHDVAVVVSISYIEEDTANFGEAIKTARGYALSHHGPLLVPEIMAQTPEIHRETFLTGSAEIILGTRTRPKSAGQLWRETGGEPAFKIGGHA